MNVLAVDTATEACSLALSLGGALHVRHMIAGRDHTALLLPMAQALMAEAGVSFAQLDGLVCGVGPGSFAGIRIGLGWAKGLALARDLPVAPVSTLATLAQGVLRRGAEGAVLACLDARMNEIYAGLYRRGADDLVELVGVERVCPPAACEFPLPAGSAVAGSGWRSYRTSLLEKFGSPAREEPDALPEALDALHLGLPRLLRGDGLRADDLVPSYLRDQVALTLVQQAAARQSIR